MKRILFTLIASAVITTSLTAQRTTDKLDRGLVAVPSGTGSFVSWRIFGEEYYDTEYNLYRDGTKIAGPLSVSNYTDPNGKAGATYQVAAVVRGKEQERCEAVKRLSQQYIQFAVKDMYDRNGKNVTGNYSINDIALADVDGDGVSEFIVKRKYVDQFTIANDTAFNCLEVYNLKGDRLWWIDLGPNMVSGPDEQFDAVGYDWDGDGKAEVLMRGADNMIIHCSDGSTVNIGNMKTNTRNTVNQGDANLAYTNTGNEYLLYIEGATGKPYSIGSGTTPLWISYPLPRGNASDWGDGYGHRSTKHYFGAPFLDGRHPFIFLGRGCYTKHHMKAFTVDPATHKLTQYWEWSNNEGWSSPWYGNGYHNFGIADVDWDGRDEICFGSMVIDDNGKGLSTTGLGHGDAQHCSDFDPYRHGQEIFACNEDEPAMNYRNATTSKIYYRLQSTGDDGRALCGNFSNDYPGAIGHSSQSGTISCVADKVITNGPTGFTNNFRIYWDGDLLEEGLDGANSREGAARVFKGNGSVVFTADGTANCNWTKNTPSATGDILGDWREEIIVRTSDNKYVRVYTTNIKTNYRNYTLWHDHQYRQGMVWESMGYNQPPHASYFLGELEGITMAPPPLTMTGRTEIANNGTISSANNDQHVIVCETNDTKITVASDAKPYMVTFNIPSWIQGTNSTNTNGNPTLKRAYYTCDITGSAFTGTMRLVKQGDGTLNLPKVDMTYTGETNVWAGVINFDGTLKNSPLWLNRFAELNSDGGTFRSIKMDYAAILRPGRADNCGTITTDTLLLGFGSRVVFDIYDDLTADQIITKYLSIETKNWEYGPQYLMPVFEMAYHGEGETTPGKYLIGSAANIQGNLGDIRIEGVPSTMKAYLVSEAGNIYVKIEGMRSATTISWMGSESALWDLDNTKNFTKGDDKSTFVTGDDVLFGDEAQEFAVSINADLEADTIFVENSKAYTFQGTGAIIGNSSLYKTGKGTLTIKNENTYTGGNRISGGAVIVTSLANSTQAKGNLGAVTTNADKFVIENGGELRTTAAVTNGSAIKFAGETGGVINNSADFISDRAMSGTVMTKRGDGWMKLNTNNASLNKMVIAAGTVQCINAGTPAKSVEYTGGTLRENTGSSYAINVPKNKRGTWYMANRATYTNKITGEGTLTAYCITEKGSTWYATRTPIQCNFSDFEGILVATSSQDDPAVLRFTLDTSSGMPKGTMNIAEKVEIQNSGRTFRIGKVTGNGTLGGSCAFSNGASVGANTWQVGNDDASWTSSVKVISNANFVKVGCGKVTWGAANTNTGTTTVQEGELCVNSTTKLGTGKLTVGADGMLSGSNTKSKALGNSSYVIDGTLRPGSYEGAITGTIYFGGKNMTISESGILAISANKCSSSASNGCTNISNIGTLTLNGTLLIIPTKTHTLQPGDSIRIWSDIATIQGTPRIDGMGIEWDDSRLMSDGLLFVKSISSGIHSTLQSQSATFDIYDLRGRLMRRGATTTEGLTPGIYIINGRKQVITR